MMIYRYRDLGKCVKRQIDVYHRPDIVLCMKETDPIILDVFKACGGPSKIAKALGISRQAVSQWGKVPLKHVRYISQRTGFSPAVLRPDIYAHF